MSGVNSRNNRHDNGCKETVARTYVFVNHMNNKIRVGNNYNKNLFLSAGDRAVRGVSYAVLSRTDRRQRNRPNRLWW